MVASAFVCGICGCSVSNNGMREYPNLCVFRGEAFRADAWTGHGWTITRQDWIKILCLCALCSEYVDKNWKRLGIGSEIEHGACSDDELARLKANVPNRDGQRGDDVDVEFLKRWRRRRRIS
jgi:hypothetical protein